MESYLDYKIGDCIHINHIEDPIETYEGREGIIKKIGRDCCKDVYFRGTWGSLSVYPDIDDIEHC